MCGIAGIWSPHKDSPSMIRRMNLALQHRGSDDSEIYCDDKNSIYLSHNRLSILDLSAHGRQPFFNETGDVAAVVNGEIYNFLELKNNLIGRGHRFCSGSDAEVVVHAYEEWGEDFVNRLDGMFALALWDQSNRKLFLARDPFGIKPLYYFQNKDIFAFASELRTFLFLDGEDFSAEMNPQAVEALLLFPYICEDEITALQGVCKLPPGHYLIAKDGNISLKCHWRLESRQNNAANDFDSISFRSLEEKLLSAVSSHLKSDVEIGMFLSGGVDSGLIAAMASKILRKPIRAFTAYFGHPLDEHLYAAKVARHVGMDHIAVPIDLKKVTNLIEEMIWGFDDLSCVDAGFFTLYLLAEEVKSRGIKVVLSGEGADEIFGGYPWFGFADFPFRYLPPAARNFLLYSRISKNIFNGTSRRGAKQFSNLFNSFDDADLFRRISRFEIRYQLPNHFLMKVDKATMAHGVETRVPYLDRGVVEAALALPKGKGEGARHPKKASLRKIAGTYLPPEIILRQKRGFLFPIAKFMEIEHEKIDSYVSGADSFLGEFISKKNRTGLLYNKTETPFIFRSARESMLWRLFVIEVWAKKFKDAKAALTKA